MHLHKIFYALDNRLEVQTDDLYTQFKAVSNRNILLSDDGVTVETSVNTEKPENIDIVQHFDHEILEEFNNDAWIEVPITALNGYSLDKKFVSGIYRLNSNHLEFKLAELSVNVKFEFNGDNIFWLKTVGNPSSDKRNTFIFKKANSIINPNRN